MDGNIFHVSQFNRKLWIGCTITFLVTIILAFTVIPLALHPWFSKKYKDTQPDLTIDYKNTYGQLNMYKTTNLDFDIGSSYNLRMNYLNMELTPTNFELSFYGVLDSQFNPIAISGESNVDWAIDAKFYNAIQKPRFTTAANLTINYIFEFKSDANTTVTSTFRNKITSGKYYYRYRFLANGYSFFTNINVPLVVEND